jgi:uncharacterized protein YnzC (UPF0291/DUF896 family)
MGNQPPDLQPRSILKQALSEDEKKELKRLAKSYVEGFMKKRKPKVAV